MTYVPLYPKQLEFLDSPALYRAFIGGRGSGKSFVACYDLLRRARPGRTYLLASPTYPMLFDSEARTLLKIGRGLNAVADYKLSAPAHVRLRSGAEILLRSADEPERLRGPNLSGAVLMEAALMHRDAYDIAIGCLRENGEQGWLSAATTPRGPAHWTYEIFATNKPNTAVVRAATGENPFNPEQFERTLQEQYGDTLFARQELAGEFVSLEGAEFPADWLAGEDLWFDAWPAAGVQWAVQSLDPSKGADGLGKDYQAHVQLAACVEGGRWVYYVDADLQREGVVPMVERAVRWAQAMHRTTARPVDSLIVEDNATMGLLPAQLEATCARLNYAANWTVRTATENKNQRIMAWVGPPLSRRQLRFRRTAGSKLLVGQLSSWPGDEFDDAPDALALALKRVTELMQGPG